MSPDSEYSSEGPRGPSEPPDGWCGRRARRRAGVGAARRVSCAGRALETLTPCGGRGRAAPVARAAGAGTRLPRRETGARGGASGAGWCEERGPAWGAAGCGEARFLRLSGARNACAGWGCGGGPHPWRERRARSGKKGGRAGGRGPLYACRGTKKIFSVKEILFINEKKFFSGRGKDEESPPPLGRRAQTVK